LASKKTQIQAIIDRHQGLKKNLIAILLDIQAERKYLPPEALCEVAAALDMPLIEVISASPRSTAPSASPPAASTPA